MSTDKYAPKSGYTYEYYDTDTYLNFQKKRDETMKVFHVNFDNKRMYNDSKYNAENIVLINKMYDYISYLHEKDKQRRES